MKGLHQIKIIITIYIYIYIYIYIVARDKVNVAFSIYSKTPTDSNQDNLRYAKENF